MLVIYNKTLPETKSSGSEQEATQCGEKGTGMELWIQIEAWLYSRHMTLGKFLLLRVLASSTGWAVMSFLVQRRDESQGTRMGTRGKETLFLPSTQSSYWDLQFVHIWKCHISMQYFKILSNCLLIKSVYDEVSHFLLWSLFCRTQLPLIYTPEAKPCSFSFTCSFLMKKLQLSSETSLWVRKAYRGVWKVVRNIIWLWFCLYHQNDQKVASTTLEPLMVNLNDSWSRIAQDVGSTMPSPMR